MEYAKTCIEEKVYKNIAAADRATASGSEEIDDDVEESWTFIGDGEDEELDIDPVLRRSVLFASAGDAGKALGTKATPSNTGVLWTNTGTTLPAVQQTVSNNSSGTSGSGSGPGSGPSPRFAGEDVGSAHAEDRGR